MRHALKTLLCPLALLLLLACAGAARAAEAASGPEQVHPLPIGSEVPELSLPEAGGDFFDLRSAILNQPTVLIFYRGGW
jgi:hypothetical protein